MHTGGYDEVALGYHLLSSAHAQANTCAVLLAFAKMIWKSTEDCAEQLLVFLIICSAPVKILKVGAIMAIIGDGSNVSDRLVVYIYCSASRFCCWWSDTGIRSTSEAAS